MPLERKERSRAASALALSAKASATRRTVPCGLGVAGVLTALLLAACGQGGASPERPEPEAQAKRGTTPAPVPTATPRRPSTDVILTFEGVQARLTGEAEEPVPNVVLWSAPRLGQSARASAELPPLPRGGETPFVRYVLEDLRVEGEGCMGALPRVEVSLVAVRGFERVARRTWTQGEALDVETSSHTYRVEIEAKGAPSCKVITITLVALAGR